MTSQIVATIIDIEEKKDKNANLFYKLLLQGSFHYFYAFSYNLPEKTLQVLKETPEKLVNQLSLITFEEAPNKNNQGTFFKVKEIEIKED